MNYKEKIMDILEFYKEIEKDYDECSKEQQKLDMSRNDLLHIIELSTFNASEGYKLSIMLKNIMSDRRKIKDKMTELLIIKDKLKLVKNIEVSLNKLDANKDIKSYRTRTLQDIFGDNIDSNYKLPFLSFEK